MLKEYSKKEFRANVFAPLEQEFAIKIYFNGEHPADETSKGYLGIANTHQVHKDICLRWQRNYIDTVQTLFHEIGHTHLHGKNSGCKKGKNYREAEAETVAKRTCELLGLPYRATFRNSPKNYIDYFWTEYVASCKTYDKEPEPIRTTEIESLAQRIAKVVQIHVI